MIKTATIFGFALKFSCKMRKQRTTIAKRHNPGRKETLTIDEQNKIQRSKS